MRDWYCSASAYERVQIFAVLAAADEPAASRRGIFTSTGGGSSATRSAARSKSRRCVAYCRFFQFISGCDATLSPLHDGARELQRRVLAHADDEVAHLYELDRGTDRTPSSGTGSARHIVCSFASGPTSSFGPSSACQMVVRYRALTLFCAAMSASVAFGLPKHRPMLVEPGRAEIVRVVGRLPVVEIDDLLDAELLAVGLDQHRMRRELESRRD